MTSYVKAVWLLVVNFILWHLVELQIYIEATKDLSNPINGTKFLLWIHNGHRRVRWGERRYMHLLLNATQLGASTARMGQGTSNLQEVMVWVAIDYVNRSP